MSSRHKEVAIALPVVLAIGFTGHRTLPDVPQSRKRICDFLTEQQAAGAETLYGVSSVAAGADLLFAESCVALGIPLRVLLPLPAEDFQDDFEAADWSRAEEVMRHAISVEVIGHDESRDERYYECGLETVQQSQMLLALWNGEPAQGLGGTEEVVNFAKQMNRPVVWIHSVTGEVTQLGPQEGTQHRNDAELARLNKLPDAGAMLANGSPTAMAEAWLAKLDANANQAAPQVRRLAAMPIVLTAMAAFLSGVAPKLQAGIWAGVGAALGVTAALLPSMLRLSKKQAEWVRIRTAAEVSRSVVALWSIPGRYKVFGAEILPELSGMLLAFNLLKQEARGMETTPIEEFKERYLATRLVGQKDYFLDKSKGAAKTGHQFRLVSKIAIVTAILLSVWVYFSDSILKLGHGHGANPLSLVAAALFQVVTVVGALIVVYDCDRRQRRYQELYQALAVWEIELGSLRTWHPLTLVVDKIERALLVELLEWRSLLQNMKMPRN